MKLLASLILLTSMSSAFADYGCAVYVENGIKPASSSEERDLMAMGFAFAGRGDFTFKFSGPDLATEIGYANVTVAIAFSKTDSGDKATIKVFSKPHISSRGRSTHRTPVELGTASVENENETFLGVTTPVGLEYGVRLDCGL